MNTDLKEEIKSELLKLASLLNIKKPAITIIDEVFYLIDEPSLKMAYAVYTKSPKEAIDLIRQKCSEIAWNDEDTDFDPSTSNFTLEIIKQIHCIFNDESKYAMSESH